MKMERKFLLMSKYHYSYKDSGVDLRKASKAIELIKKPVFSTFSSNVLNDLTSYAGLFKFDSAKYKEPVLVSSTDGVGSKLLIAKDTGNFEYIGQDLVAMCINDILCCGAKPLFFLDYIACGRVEPEKIKIVVESVAKSCSECDTALVGGEIAEMPDIYKIDDIDLAGFVVGVVEKSNIIKTDKVRENDVIAGFPSSGVHSNGFSLIRKLVKDKKLSLKKNFGSGIDKTLGEELITPTKLYYKAINKMLYGDINCDIHGLAHITGGGFYENINRLLPDRMDAEIAEGSWPVPDIFKFLQHSGNINKKEMYRVFNMGIGMVIIINPEDFNKIKIIASLSGENIYRIGKIIHGNRKVLIRKK
jgi:phosphoribosylformylglycinamidine cyclo-ligase